MKSTQESSFQKSQEQMLKDKQKPLNPQMNIFSKTELKCINNNEGFFYCSQCDKSAVVCSNPRCECYSEHKDCQQFQKIDTLHKNINKKLIRFSIHANVKQISKKIINQTQKLQDFIETEMQVFGLSDLDQNFVKNVKKIERGNNNLLGLNIFQYKKQRLKVGDNDWIQQSLKKYITQINASKRYILNYFAELEEVIVEQHYKEYSGQAISNKNFLNNKDASRNIEEQGVLQKPALSFQQKNQQQQRPNLQDKKNLLDNSNSQANVNIKQQQKVKRQNSNVLDQFIKINPPKKISGQTQPSIKNQITLKQFVQQQIKAQKNINEQYISLPRSIPNIFGRQELSSRKQNEVKIGNKSASKPTQNKLINIFAPKPTENLFAPKPVQNKTLNQPVNIFTPKHAQNKLENKSLNIFAPKPVQNQPINIFVPKPVQNQSENKSVNLFPPKPAQNKPINIFAPKPTQSKPLNIFTPKPKDENIKNIFLNPEFEAQINSNKGWRHDFEKYKNGSDQTDLRKSIFGKKQIKKDNSQDRKTNIFSNPTNKNNQRKQQQPKKKIMVCQNFIKIQPQHIFGYSPHDKPIKVVIPDSNKSEIQQTKANIFGQKLDKNRKNEKQCIRQYISPFNNAQNISKQFPPPMSNPFKNNLSQSPSIFDQAPLMNQPSSLIFTQMSNQPPMMTKPPLQSSNSISNKRKQVTQHQYTVFGFRSAQNKSIQQQKPKSIANPFFCNIVKEQQQIVKNQQKIKNNIFAKVMTIKTKQHHKLEEDKIKEYPNSSQLNIFYKQKQKQNTVSSPNIFANIPSNKYKLDENIDNIRLPQTNFNQHQSKVMQISKTLTESHNRLTLSNKQMQMNLSERNSQRISRLQYAVPIKKNNPFKSQIISSKAPSLVSERKPMMIQRSSEQQANFKQQIQKNKINYRGQKNIKEIELNYKQQQKVYLHKNQKSQYLPKDQLQQRIKFQNSQLNEQNRNFVPDKNEAFYINKINGEKCFIEDNSRQLEYQQSDEESAPWGSSEDESSEEEQNEIKLKLDLQKQLQQLQQYICDQIKAKNSHIMQSMKSGYIQIVQHQDKKQLQINFEKIDLALINYQQQRQIIQNQPLRLINQREEIHLLQIQSIQLQKKNLNLIGQKDNLQMQYKCEQLNKEEEQEQVRNYNVMKMKVRQMKEDNQQIQKSDKQEKNQIQINSNNSQIEQNDDQQVEQNDDQQVEQNDNKQMKEQNKKQIEQIKRYISKEQQKNQQFLSLRQQNKPKQQKILFINEASQLDIAVQKQNIDSDQKNTIQREQIIKNYEQKSEIKQQIDSKQQLYCRKLIQAQNLNNQQQNS